MSRLTKEMKEYLSMAKDAGLTVLSHTRHRNHMKIRVEAPSGEQSIIVAPVSVSDWRGRVTVGSPDDFPHEELVMVCTHATDPDDLADAIRHETKERGPFKPAWGYGISRAST